MGRFQTSGYQTEPSDKSLNKGFKILQNIPKIPYHIAGIFFSGAWQYWSNILVLPTFCLFAGS
jgi:hypothetical protein